MSAARIAAKRRSTLCEAITGLSDAGVLILPAIHRARTGWLSVRDPP
jgi:hypothetical protein